MFLIPPVHIIGEVPHSIATDACDGTVRVWRLRACVRACVRARFAAPTPALAPQRGGPHAPPVAAVTEGGSPYGGLRPQTEVVHFIFVWSHDVLSG